VQFPNIEELSLNLRNPVLSFKAPQPSSLMMAPISGEAIKPIRVIPDVTPVAFIFMSV